MTPNPSVSNQYWCTLDQEDFAKEYFARATKQAGFQGYGALTRLQRLAYRHYYGALPTGFVGALPSSAMAQRSGEQGENVEVNVNWLYAHVNAKHQIVVAPKLAWGAQAVNTDARSMADASRAASILEYLWKTGPYEELAISATLGGILAGEEFLLTLWDKQAGKALAYDKESEQVSYEGDVRCFAVSSWDVFRNQRSKTFDESPWLSARVPRNRWDLIAQYPDMRDEILAVPAGDITNPNVGSTTLESQSDPDTVVCHYFFHKLAPAAPNGLQAVLLTPDCVLEYGALEKCYQHLPIHRFRARNLKGTPYPYTSCWEAMGVQDLATDVQGSLATNIVAFAKQMISAEDDQNLAVNQVGNGPAVLYRPKGSQPPEAIQLYAPNPEMFQHLERYKGDQRMILGLNDMAMGEPPQGPPNAQAWALLATANITNNSDEQRGYIAGVKSVGRSLIDIIKEKMDKPRKVAIVGKYGAAVPEQEQYDKTAFAGIEDVTIDIENPLMQTAAGRLPISQMFLEQGFVQVPEQLETLITTGKLEPLTQVLNNEMIFIATENEALLRGETPTAMITDSHQMHIREHKDAMFSAEGRSNPETITAYNAHQQQHFQLALNSDPRILALLGQAAPQPPAMPGAPGGGDESGAESPLQPPGVPAQGEAAGVKLPQSPVSPEQNSPAPQGGVPQ